jgi:thiamine-phosphate pyrophosphorylase
MSTRQTDWPRTWLMTDERVDDRLWDALDRLPPHSGVVFRHYSLPVRERASLAAKVATVCQERDFTLAVARDLYLARAVSADLIHNPSKPVLDLPVSIAVHSYDEAQGARDASLVFVSPVFGTRSHSDAEPLGPDLAQRLAKAAGVPAIALGGMNACRFAQLEGFHGWAGIDAWLSDDGD